MAFFCKKCGRQENDIRTLVQMQCVNGGKCEPYTGHESGPYHCRKCGRQEKDIRTLVFMQCVSGGKCEPIE